MFICHCHLLRIVKRSLLCGKLVEADNDWGDMFLGKNGW